MKYERRENKNGSAYYSFVWYDNKTKRPVRLTREEIKKRFGKDILTEAEAKECLQLLAGQFESEKVRIERRLQWQEKFYSFKTLVDQYEIKQKKTAPNSWENSVFYLKHYVLPFFLTEKRLNGVELWSDYFEDFKEWLEKDARLIRNPKKPISYASKNHAIKSLNTFLSQLYKSKLLQQEYKCEGFGEHLCNKRDFDDVIHPEEMEKIETELNRLGYETEADLFRFLYDTGMRFHEAVGVSLADIYQGELAANILNQKLKFFKMKYYGYVVINSQFNGKVGSTVLRKPLKGTKEISERVARTIPITDKKLWNRIVTRAEAQFKKFKNGESSDKKDYLIFEGIDDTTARIRLIEAFRNVKLKYRSWHCCRHSRATWLIGQTGDHMLATIWLGHKNPRTIEKYNHIYQAITRQAKRDEGSGFSLKKV